MGREPLDWQGRPKTTDTHPVEVEGQSRIVVSGMAGFPREVRTCTIACASGERTSATWTGVPIATLVDVAEFSGTTTHLHVEADDFTAQVPIRPAIDGILAFDRSDGRRSKLPRLVASDVSGERLVKRVRRISAVELAPEDEPFVG